MLKKAIMLSLSLLMVATLASCFTTPPDDIVKTYLDHLKAGEIDKMRALMANAEEGGFDPEGIEQAVPGDVEYTNLLKSMTYKIGRPTISGNEAEVPVEITALDLGAMLGDVMEEYLPLAMKLVFEGADQTQLEAEASRIFEEKLKEGNLKLATNNATIPLTKVEGKWLIDFDEESIMEFTNAITGGLENFISKMQELFGQ